MEYFLHLTYPHLHSFAVNKNIKLSDVLNEDSTQSLFHLPFSEEALIQYCELEMVLQPLQANNNLDTWKYIWGAKECSS
jgi:hypothetical protein